MTENTDSSSGLKYQLSDQRAVSYTHLDVYKRQVYTCVVMLNVMM